MNITWRDGATSLLSLAVIGFSYLMIYGSKMPLVGSYRVGALVLMLLGIGMCALSGYKSGTQSSWVTLANLLGSIAIILIIATLITGSKTLFLALGGTIVILWLGTTFRHLIN